MKKAWFVFNVIVVITFSISRLQAQTGIFYYPVNNELLPHAQALHIVPLPHGHLMLLNKNSDPQYNRMEMLFIEIDNNGNKINSFNIAQEDLYELVKMEPVGEAELVVLGNKSLNKELFPFSLKINKKGEVIEQTDESSIYSNFINDAAYLENNKALVLYTKTNKTDKYNISLHQVNLKNNKIEWLKKISSEQNEEATQVIKTPDNMVYVLGKKYNDEVTDYVPIIYKLTSDGNQIWKIGVDVPSNFYKQSICFDENNNVVYACGYTKNPTGFSETRVVKFNKNGQQEDYCVINDFSSNGILKLSDNNFLLYGSKFYVDEKQVVTKARYIIINENLTEKANVFLTDKDKPDADIESERTTSSDLLTAIELENGKIALAGKVFMPNAITPEKRQNNPLLIIINKDGSY